LRKAQDSLDTIFEQLSESWVQWWHWLPPLRWPALANVVENIFPRPRTILDPSISTKEGDHSRSLSICFVDFDKDSGNQLVSLS
jgi:hypothetical protein